MADERTEEKLTLVVEAGTLALITEPARWITTGKEVYVVDPNLSESESIYALIGSLLDAAVFGWGIEHDILFTVTKVDKSKSPVV